LPTSLWPPVVGKQTARSVPAADTVHPDDGISLIPGDGLEKHHRFIVHVLCEAARSLLFENTGVYFPGMEINAAILSLLPGRKVDFRVRRINYKKGGSS